MTPKYFILTVFTAISLIACSSSKKTTEAETTPKSKDYVIKVKIKGLTDSVAYLANYVGKDIYYFDTAIVKDGKFEFRKQNIPHGVYAVVARLKPTPVLFDIIVNEKYIEFETDINDPIFSMKIKKSKENKLFFKYIQNLQKKSLLKRPLMQQRDTLDRIKDSLKIRIIEDKVIEIDNSVGEYQKKFSNENIDLLVGKLMKTSVEIEIPEPPKGTENSREWKYNYYKNHFFDNIDLTDDRLGRTTLFHNQIEKYFTQVILQTPDSIIARLPVFMDQLTPGGPMMKYAIKYLTYYHIKTRQMGMDAVYVFMCDNYILNGKCDWINKEAQDKIRPKVNKMRPTIIGKIAPNIILADTSEKKWHGLHEIKAEYTLLIFWSDDCGHCKKEIPKYKRFYDSINKNTDIDLKVYAVCTHLENPGWVKFVKENNLDWINVSDFPDLRTNWGNYIRRTIMRNGIAVNVGYTTERSINFRNSYDVFVTPIGFLLDNNKKILAKQFDVKQLGGILNHEVKMNKKK